MKHEAICKFKSFTIQRTCIDCDGYRFLQSQNHFCNEQINQNKLRKPLKYKLKFCDQHVEHEFKTDFALVHPQSEPIAELFRCKLCHGLLNQPRTCKECNHNFCQFCITNYLFNNSGKCPECFSKVESLNKLPINLVDILLKIKLKCRDCNSYLKYKMLFQHREHCEDVKQCKACLQKREVKLIQEENLILE